MSASRIDLTWSDNATNEDEYLVNRSTDAGSSWTQIARLGANATSYSDNTVAASTTYRYQVFAKNSAGSAGSNTADATTPAASSNITIASITTNAIGNRNVWMAEFTVTIVDGNNNPVSGATVDGSFSGGYSGSVSETTNASGQFTFPSDWVHKNIGSITFTVTKVTKSGENWDTVQKSATAYKP